MTKKEIIDYVMETPQNTNPAILSQMLDEIAGEGGGSGDSSNFSVAKVTLINNTSEPDVTFKIPGKYEGVEGEHPSSTAPEIIVEQELVVDAVLYCGYCVGCIYSALISFTLTGTGNVTINGLYAYITGDCTITISDSTQSL